MAKPVDSDARSEEMIKIQPGDGHGQLGGRIFEVKKSVAVKWAPLKTMIEELEDDEAPVPLKDIESHVFEKVIEFIGHYEKVHEDAGGEPEKRDLTEWDKEFLENLDSDMLRKVIEAANFLGQQDLLDTCGMLVCSWLKGKTVEEARIILNITDPGFPPGEEERIRKENEWAFFGK